jgi:Leucine-rich repeat (LRR) protein
LEVLDCANNKLTSLPAPLPPALRSLVCRNNQLTTLDVTGLSLYQLVCSYNNMTSTSDVKGFTGTWGSVNFRFDPQNKGIFGTNPRYNQWWAYILFFLCFGFIWMWF